VSRDIDDSSENVLSEWSRRGDAPEEPPAADEAEAAAWGASAPAPDGDPGEDTDPRLEEHSVEAVAAPQPSVEEELEEEAELPEVEVPEEESGGIAVEPSLEHAAGDLEIPERASTGA
jgi:hypothetical protein